MNVEVLKKCVDELGKENPKLDYVRGMLETIIALQPPTVTFNKPAYIPKESAQVSETKDEAAILDAQAKAALASMKVIPE